MLVKARQRHILEQEPKCGHAHDHGCRVSAHTYVELVRLQRAIEEQRKKDRWEENGGKSDPEPAIEAVRALTDQAIRLQ